MASRPVVWVVKEQVVRVGASSVPMDYTPAYKYGDIRFITEIDLPIHQQQSTLRDAWMKKVDEFVAEFQPGDYVILTGSPLAIFLVGYICALADIEPTILVWRRESNEYLPMDLGLFSRDATIGV